MPNNIVPLILIIVTIVIFVSMLIFYFSRYKKCPSDKIMVIYGAGLGNRADGTSISARCLHGGAAFIWPIIQSYAFLSLEPIGINIDLKYALTKHDDIKIDLLTNLTIAISVKNALMQNAAERLLGLKSSEIQELTKDIILGQLRLVISSMSFEEINKGRDKFLEVVCEKIETEINKIGLNLININIVDVKISSY